ncbi:MAG: class I SAM-dependent methyltransferase [Bacteroidia bacterium]|nr:class I SAM-dependent methyltransferase [Bacteroidia bacterium]MDW8014842.1 class I SAM-dependent methyltransferase [Bacteroidia bacterium]
MEYHILTAQWESYRLIDFGEGWRWEYWGKYSVMRPDGWAVGRPSQPRSRWTPQHVYHPMGAYQGKWEPPLPEKWILLYRSKRWQMKLWCRTGKFKHMGLFPEQAPHWDWLHEWISQRQRVRILNLFAYTGAASIAAALAGAQVIHVDSSRSAIKWAAENASLNNIQTIRWLVEDARRFVQRAARRRETYDGILLDPPAYGIGTKGRRWELQQDLPILLAELLPLLSTDRGLFLLNLYTGDFSPYTVKRIIQETLPLPLEVGELTLPTPEGRLLSTGLFFRCRW